MKLYKDKFKNHSNWGYSAISLRLLPNRLADLKDLMLLQNLFCQ